MTMNILVCDQPFDLSAGAAMCPGQLGTVAYEGNPASAGLTWQEVEELQDGVLVLFAVVFGFLVLRKLL